MSSTNRGYDRHIADYYVTPKQPVLEFLSEFLELENIQRPDRFSWLDPCCGGDKDNSATYLEIIKEEFEPNNFCGIDIREDSHADLITDYLKYNKEDTVKYDIIISNPPFYLAEDFIKKSIDLVENEGYVIMLLRLNFFGSAKRKIFFDTNMPKYCFIHHKRINFIPDSMKKKMKNDGLKTSTGDSIEYAHFVWKKGYDENYCKTFLI